MRLWNLYGKRRARELRKIRDVYEYDTLPTEFRIQVAHAVGDLLGFPVPDRVSRLSDWYGLTGEEFVTFLVNGLCKEWGRFTLSQASTRHDYAGLAAYLASGASTDEVLSIIEAALGAALSDAVPQRVLGQLHPIHRTKDYVEEINHRFEEHGLGYSLEGVAVIRREDEYLHRDVVRPALTLLSAKRFAQADQELRAAFQHHGAHRYRDCLGSAGSALESVLKVICNDRGWGYEDRDTAKHLLTKIMEKGLVGSLHQSHFTALLSLLESGAPTIRNKRGPHGQGPEAIPVSAPLATFMLHTTAAVIQFLVSADKPK